MTDASAVPKGWNKDVLNHPALTPAEKLAFHLLVHYGDTAQAGQQMAHMLNQTDRHIRRMRHKLRQLNLWPIAEEHVVSTPDPIIPVRL